MNKNCIGAGKIITVHLRVVQLEITFGEPLIYLSSILRFCKASLTPPFLQFYG